MLCSLGTEKIMSLCVKYDILIRAIPNDMYLGRKPYISPVSK